MKIIGNNYQLLFLIIAVIVIQVADLARQKYFVCVCLGLYLNVNFPSPQQRANVYALCQHCRVIKSII